MILFLSSFVEIDHVTNVRNIRKKISVYFTFAIVLGGSIVFVINYAVGTHSVSSLLALLVFGFLMFVSLYRKKELLAENIIIFGSLFLVFRMSYETSSAMVYLSCGLIILLSAIYEKKYLTHIIFAISYVGMFFFVLLKKFTVVQIIVPEYNVGLNNNIQIPLVFIFVAYLMALLINRAFISTIDLQKSQYTDLQDAQKALLSQTKIDTLKILAGGLSHDFNNLLTILIGQIQLSLFNEELPGDIKENLKEMEQATLKARNLTGQMLNMVKDNTTILGEISNFQKLLTSTVEFSIKGTNTIPIFELGNLWVVIGDPMQLSQVIQNISINAAQAMTRGGILKVIARNTELTSNNSYNLPSGHYLEVHFIDQGPGVTEDLGDSIFELFQTTKADGSGIGLAVSKKIIEQHSGYIHYNTNPTGSDFFFFVPAYIDSIEDLTVNNTTGSETFKGNVMIYDDNRDVLKVLISLFRRLGMQVYDASDGQSFLNLLDSLLETSLKIDLFILDLVLPGDITGEQMAVRIREKMENPYIVVSSGYSPEFIFSQYKNYSFDNVLRKPYLMADLVKVLSHRFNIFAH